LQLVVEQSVAHVSAALHSAVRKGARHLTAPVGLKNCERQPKHPGLSRASVVIVVVQDVLAASPLQAFCTAESSVAVQLVEVAGTEVEEPGLHAP
jgi:hypothetical protein